MIRLSLSALLIFSFAFIGFAQFGFQSIVGYNIFEESKIEKFLAPSNSMHYSLGPSYWFRLRSKRIEFNPAVVFDYNKSEFSKNDINEGTLSEYNITFSLPILIYPLDFGNDCNCPTFNKSGQFFEKGFYFLIYPAIPYSSKKIEGIDLPYLKTYTSFQLGLGAGVDIGINKKWTLSPSLMISKLFQDRNILDTDQQIILDSENNRYRIDLMVRLLWFAKKRR